MIAIRGYAQPEPEDVSGGPPARWRDLVPGDFERPRPPRPGFDPARGEWWKRISYWWTYSRAELEALARAFL